MLLALLRAIARLPLAWYHALGAALGWVVYLASPTYAARLRENLRLSGVWSDEADYRRMLRACIAETGRGGLASPAGLH